MLAAALLASAFAPLSAHAALNEADLRVRMARIQRHLNALATKMSEAEHIHEAAEDKIRRHRAAIARAAKLLGPLRTSLNARAAQLYILGAGGFVEGALGSEDLSQFLDRFSYLEQVADAEQGAYEQLFAVSRRARKESKMLQSALVEAAKAKASLDAQRKKLDDALAEYKSLLDLVNLNRYGTRASRTRGPAGFQCPVAGPRAISNNYGDPRPGGAHAGIDITSPHGTPVVAVLSGRIVDKPSGGWWGLGIVLRDAAGNEWWYAHLSSRSVSVGEFVNAGEAIGRVGCSGRCTGPHLHFEYHPGGGGPSNPYRILIRAC